MTRWFIPSATGGECSEIARRNSKSGKLALRSSQDQAARNHVVKGLLLFRKSRHGVTDPQGNQPGDELCKIPSGGVTETDGATLRVRDDQPKRHFPERSLMPGTFHPGIVNPGEQHRRKAHENDRGNHRCGYLGVFAVHAFDHGTKRPDADNRHGDQD